MCMVNKYGLKVDHWCNPTSTLNMLLSPPTNRAPSCGNLSTMFCISLTYFSGTLHSIVHIQISSLGTLCLGMKIASSVVPLLGMNPTYNFHEFPCILTMGSDQFLVLDRIFCSMWQWSSLCPTT